MKVVLQRVSQASVFVDRQEISSIGAGLVVLLGIEQGDQEKDSTALACKIAELRIFADQDQKMNKSILEIQGSILLISQFTLAADLSKGRRPSFIKAADPEEAKFLYEHFAKTLESLSLPVKQGIFGTHMEVSLVNDGPVTFILEQ